MKDEPPDTVKLALQIINKLKLSGGPSLSIWNRSNVRDDGVTGPGPGRRPYGPFTRGEKGAA